MRQKFSYFIAFFLLFFNCNNDSKHLITENTFKNKTFVSYYESEKDSLIVEFTDSTYQYLNFSKERRNWRITYYDNSTFLILDRIAIGIKQLNDSTFKCFNVSYNDVEFEMRLRKPKWKKEKIYGKWVEDIHRGKTEDFFPPFPVPYPKEDYSWPPFYEISENKIVSNYYLVNESKYEINNSNEYLFMCLNNYKKGEELEWRIKVVTDSTLIISRMIDRTYQDYDSNEFSEDIKLIRIDN